MPLQIPHQVGEGGITQEHESSGGRFHGVDLYMELHAIVVMYGLVQLRQAGSSTRGP